MKYLFTILSLVCLLSGPSLRAQLGSESFGAKFLVEGGIEFGGDEILQVFFTNGGDQTMRAGQGGYLAVGGEFEFFSNFLFRPTIGFKYTTTAAENANIRLTRLPLSLMGYYKANPSIRLGIGVTTQLSAKLNGDGFIDDVDYSSSLGPRFEVGYRVFALSYSLLTYEDPAGEEVSASAIGLSVSFTIPGNK